MLIEYPVNTLELRDELTFSFRWLDAVFREWGDIRPVLKRVGRFKGKVGSHDVCGDSYVIEKPEDATSGFIEAIYKAFPPKYYVIFGAIEITIVYLG